MASKERQGRRNSKMNILSSFYSKRSQSTSIALMLLMGVFDMPYKAQAQSLTSSLGLFQNKLCNKVGSGGAVISNSQYDKNES